MKQVFYLKSNRRDGGWKYQSTEHIDWENFPINEKQGFYTYHRNAQYWKAMEEGDIVIGHSSIQSKLKNGKRSFFPCARLSAICLVTKTAHESNDGKNEIVTLEKVIHLRHQIILTSELLKKFKLEKAEPFLPGSNRCTLTKLQPSEYKSIIELTKTENPDISKRIKEINTSEK